MEFIDIAWALMLVLFTGFMIEMCFAKRSGIKAYQGVKQEVQKSPVYKIVSELMLDPNFDKFIAETIESIKILNKQVKKIEKEGLGCLLK